MEAVRVETKVQSNGRVVVENLPFDEGDLVEVIVLESDTTKSENRVAHSKGKLLKYIDPFEPAVTHEDWEALK